MNYRVLSGKYIVYENETNRNGKICDAFKNRLIYEGGIISGRKNGIGIEYDYKGKLTFEGEYLNGKRNGKGKDYDYNCKLLFEGEYLNGIRNGKGKEYDYNGIIKFGGEYLNGKNGLEREKDITYMVSSFLKENI